MTRGELLVRGAAGGAGLFLSGSLGRGPAQALLGPGSARAATIAPATVQHFVSRPGLEPPRITVMHPAQGTADGYLFVAPSSGPGQRGAMIFDNRGELVWFHPVSGPTVMDFKVGLYHGKPVLMWWEGKSDNHGLGKGELVIMDDAYREVARFGAAGGRDTDLHDFVLTPRNTALLTSYEIVTRDLTSVGGRKRGVIVGSIVQEVEIPSSRLLWSWHSLDHVAPDESYAKVGPRFDYFHLNSIDVDADGSLIVSARNTWAVYKIDSRTGRVIWRLGGRRSDFKMGYNTTFAWQHDARIHDGGRLISIFDDGAAPQVQPQSRGLLLALDTTRMRATLRHKYTHRPGRLITDYMGDVQLLPNGNVLVGWGNRPYLTEFARAGGILFDAKLPKGGESYRAFRFPWVGRPADTPALAARRTASGSTLYASWNGATELASWQLLEGADRSSLQASLTVPRAGFETMLRPASQASRYAAVVALDAHGAPLARSSTVDLTA